MKIIIIILSFILLVGCNGQNINDNSVQENELINQIEIEEEIEKEPDYTDLLGKIIVLDGGDYRVIEVDTSEVKVVAITSACNMAFGSAGTIDCDGIPVAKYSGSAVDNFLNNTWYNSLSEDLKNAIIPKEIKQSAVSHITRFFTDEVPTGTYYSSTWNITNEKPEASPDYYVIDNYSMMDIGERYVYLLDIKDIFQYLDKVYTPEDVDNIFTDDDTACTSFIWFRTAERKSNYYTGNLVYGFSPVRCGSITAIDEGISSGGFMDNGCAVHPAFVVDLSKINYEIK